MIKGDESLTAIIKTSNRRHFKNGNRTIGDKVYSQKGNSPDCKLRSLNIFLVKEL